MVSLIKNASFYEKSDDNVFHGGHLGIDGSHFENLCPIIFFSTAAFKIYMVSLIKNASSYEKNDDNVFHGGHLGIDGSHFEKLCPIMLVSTHFKNIYGFPNQKCIIL